MGGRRFNGRFLPVLVDTRLGQLGRPKLEADWEYQTLIGTIKGRSLPPCGYQNYVYQNVGYLEPIVGYHANPTHRR